MIRFLLAGVACLAFACTKSSEAPQPATPSGSDTAASLAALQQLVDGVAGRAEKDTGLVRVQHILVGYKGAPRMTGMTRSLEEAKQRTADLLARLKKGEDFAQLMRQNSDDPGPGIYTMYLPAKVPAPPPGAMRRTDMVAAFGDVGWRLDVNEIGVAPQHDQKSPFGYHIIKRLE